MAAPVAGPPASPHSGRVCGQRICWRRAGMFRSALEQGRVPNMIFYGPPGSGQDHGGPHHC